MSICSSNITKDSTPLKNKLIHKENEKEQEIEENELIESISSFIEETIQRNQDKKKYSKKTVFYSESPKIPDISI